MLNSRIQKITQLGFSLRLSVHHNASKTFGCIHTLASHQYKVNLGQNEVRLLKKQLKTTQNNVIWLL